MTLHIAVLVTAIAVGAGIQPASTRTQESRDATVRGCLERDAASRSPVYKLVSNGQIFRLEGSGDFAANVGHTVEATGSVSKRETARGREENVLSVRSLKSVAPTCS